MFSLAFDIIAFIIFFAFCTYACIFADPDTSAVGRFFARDVPSLLYRMLERMLGQKQLAQLAKIADRAFQIFYLVVVLGSWSIVFAYGYPMIQKSTYVHSYHQYTGYAVFLLCMGSWHYACHVGPGNITARTIPLYDHYEYDNILYTNKLCRTLKIRKIARSKYDRCTNRHVPKFDHFCGWLNQAVGERNYRWFLLFLVTQVLMCCYGTWAMTTLLYEIIVEKDLLHATFFNAVTGAEVQADYVIIFHYLFATNMQICGVILLMSVMSVVLAIFLGFHIYITSFGMTTNEAFKWKRVKKWHKAEKQKYEKALKEGNVGKKVNLGALSNQVPDGDVGCTGPVGGASGLDALGDDEIIDPGPMPTYLYHKGILANWSEALFPLSLRDEAIRRYRATARDMPENDGANQSSLPDDDKTK